MRISHGILVLIIIASASYAYNDGSNNQTITELPNTQLMVHRATNINFSVTNFGFLGSQGGDFDDFEGIFDPAPGAMYPAGSDIDYLFQGAIWIGAEIDRVDRNGNRFIDTLVSIGNDGWWGNIYELYPEEVPNGAMWRDNQIADEEIYAVYYDTCTGPFVVPDPNDQRPHIPLGLKISQVSRGWSTPGFNEFIILDYIIENISSSTLQNTWMGIYYDGDVWNYPQGGNIGAQDDICGYIQHGDYGIGWIADNDGEPDDTLFDELSPTGVLGLTLLGSTAPGLETNFNWWISNVNSAYDWGPQLLSNYNGPFPGGGQGTPGGDKAKYFVMSNGEHDYGQMWCNLTTWQNNGWIPRSPQAADLADGYDTRFLISFGPFDLPAGEVGTLTVAYIGGSQFHTDADNFQTYLQNHTSDSNSIAQYYANLGFDQFNEMADSAISFFENGYVNIPPGPPSNLRVTDWSSGFVKLEWFTVFPPNFLEYRIYRGTEPGVYDPQKLTPDGFADSLFIDSSVVNNQTYYYVIASANIMGLEGAYSNEAVVNTGQPHAPTGLTAEGGNAEIQLSWNPHPEPDIAGFIIYRAIESGTFGAIDTTTANSYLDPGLLNGHDYFYYLKAIDNFQNISYDSDTASALPMGFDSGILLVNGTMTGGNPDYDSMMIFYDNVLQNYDHTRLDNPIIHLSQMAPYSTVIFGKETFNGGRLNLAANRNMYRRYLGAGGNILIAGSRQIAPTLTFAGIVEYTPSDFEYQYLNLSGSEYHNAINSLEFTGAVTNSPSFDTFSLDSARTERIIFPPNVPWGIYAGIAVFMPNDSSEVIYNFQSIDPDTSTFHGRPVAIIHQTTDYNTAILEFPLYFVEEPVSYDILHEILELFGEEQTGTGDDYAALPRSTGLLQNYPNPFNNSTTIRYNLTEPGDINITIYNILGQKVAEPANEFRQAGVGTFTWNADRLPSGIYFARMETGGYNGSIKLLLIK